VLAWPHRRALEASEPTRPRRSARPAQINVSLRSGIITPATQAFLDEFAHLNSYAGRAYRAAYVTPNGAERLRRGVGESFRDAGVQSASTQFFNALEWRNDRWTRDAAPAAATKQVVYIYDDSVNKKNLADTFLADHVAVVPGAVTKVLAVQEVDDVLYVLMTSPTKMPDRIFNPYTGEEAV